MGDGYVHPEFLVDTEWLASRRDDRDLVILDATTHTTPPPPKPYGILSGRAGFEQGHIPGAQFVDIDAELSQPEPPSGLHFMLPSPAHFGAAMARLGIGDDTFVVCYSSAKHWWATRLWWMLGVFGHDRAAVLNGGFGKWTAEARPIETGSGRSRARTATRVRHRPERVADKHEVFAAIATGDICILNALPAENHRGEGGTDYGRPGHIAGSINVPAADLVNADNSFKPADELRRLLAEPLAKPRIIAYCGGGISATSPALALALLGHRDVRVYDGSLSEWAPDPSLPMAVGH
ncbi:MAG: sulfurtransferase [Rhodocyclaceae bacterium]|nr:MAG: sulfurtransferase [Rhodocyclaceae bacterium]